MIERRDRIEHIFQFMEYEYLTDWEDNFVASVSEQFDRKGSLSDKQYEVLENVFKKAAERDRSVRF